MEYFDFQGKKISRLGFGAMRLPMAGEKIDEAHTARMINEAMSRGVNYFDTAYPYHEGESERVVGKILNRYPRESWYLATKYPGHQDLEDYSPAAIFEDQLKKCGVEYFDFYLLHNVCERAAAVYESDELKVVEYFLAQKAAGRIRHLGFSTHARLPYLKSFLERYGDQMEFCQIQCNYLDWSLQSADEKYRLLTEHGIPVWVMEPLRGGKLCAADPVCVGLPADRSATALSFDFLRAEENIGVILSGMSNEEQMKENISIFEQPHRLTDQVREKLFALAERMKDAVPCTACRYCTAGCPMGLNIPLLISLYNDVKYTPDYAASMYLDTLPQDKRPAACIGCGACAAICPQGIDIPSLMKDFVSRQPLLPDWGKICRERNAAAKGE